MDLKTLFGLTVLPAATLGAVITACVSKRLRDMYFIVLVFSAPLIERLDLNYVSREWYRGTSRGFEVAVADVLALALLASSVLVPRAGHRRLYWVPSLGFMLLLFFYACFNVGISEPHLFGLFGLWRLMRGMLLVMAVAFYLQSEREARLLVLGVCLLIGYQALLAIKQRYLDGVHRIYGTCDESNSLSVLLVTSTPLLVTGITARLPRILKWLCVAVLPLACVAEILTISRAGVVIIGLVLLGATLSTASLRLTPRTVGVSLLVLLGAAGMLAKSWKTLSARYEEASLKDEYENKKNLGRGYYLRVAREIAGQRFFGVGLNNWSYWVSNLYGPKLGYRFVPYSGPDREPRDTLPPDANVDMPQAAPAHNLGALTVGELGIPGFALFSILWLRWFQMGGSFLRPRNPDPMRRLGVGLFFGICGTFLQCLTEWAWWHLPVYYTFHILLGALAALYYQKRCAKKAAARQAELEEAPGPMAPAHLSFGGAV